MFECFKKKVSKPRDRVIHAPPKEIKDFPASFLDVALDITMSFEGSGFGQASGNFDGQGISAGGLQWNYGQGSLQSKILMPFINKYGSNELNKFFKIDIASTATMTPKQAISFAKKNMLRPFKTSIKPEVYVDLVAFLKDPRTIEIQKEAARSIANKAWHYCELYEMRDIMSFCFFFDVVTQNGGLKSYTPADKIKALQAYDWNIKDSDCVGNRNQWIDAKKLEHSYVLFDLILRRASKNKWRQDVVSRKGTLCHRLGVVHGKTLDLRAVIQ